MLTGIGVSLWLAFLVLVGGLVLVAWLVIRTVRAVARRTRR